MIQKFYFTLFLVFLVCVPGWSQILIYDPLFPTVEDTITIIYDATRGDGGLIGASTVYAHTGVLTEDSEGSSDWKYVKTGWGQNTPETRLEALGGDKWRIRIHPRSYYGIPDSVKVTHLAFVFRNESSSRTGRAADGGDIFLPIYEPGVNVSLFRPVDFPLFVEKDASFQIVAFGSNVDRMMLWIEDNLVYETTDDTLIYWVDATEYGKKTVKIRGENATGDSAEVSFYYMVNPPVEVAPLPVGITEGINYLSDTEVTLCLFSPSKKFVYVIGDFTDWEIDPAFYMKRTPDGWRYWLTISGLTPQQEYIFQYFVNGTLRIADPFAEKVSDPWNDQYIEEATYPNLIPYPAGKTSEIAAVLQTAQPEFEWQVTDFQRPSPENLVIYELLIRDFIKEHNYQTLIDTLGYFERLGINAIELMPVMEFEGNDSWGYNPSFYFAPDKYYGPKEDLKRFIDACHQRGIAVILDMVLNHSFGQSPFVRLYSTGNYGPPSDDNFWYNVRATHPYSVGYDFNHESQATQILVDRVNAFWINEYQVDGFRFDLSKGFTQKETGDDVGAWGAYDGSRVALLTRMADQIWKIDPHIYIILEHFADNSEEKVLAEYRNGMMLWGKMNGEYSQSAMAWLEDQNSSSDLSWGYYQNRNWLKPHLVTYMESHDEPWLMYRQKTWGRQSGSYDTRELVTAIKRLKLAYAFFLTIPGPKMLWQFGELGYDRPLAASGVERTARKPILWEYYEDPVRRELYDTISLLLKIRREHRIFRIPETSVEMRVGQGQYDRLIHLTLNDTNVTVVGNFNMSNMYIYPDFQHAGTWFEFFSGDTLQIADPNAPMLLTPGEFRIYSNIQMGTGVRPEKNVPATNFGLLPNYPNPFNPGTEIRYKLSRASTVTLEIFNALGQRVRRLVHQKEDAGLHQIRWDGCDDSTSAVSSGVYFIHLQTNQFQTSRKMMLLR